MVHERPQCYMIKLNPKPEAIPKSNITSQHCFVMGSAVGRKRQAAREPAPGFIGGQDDRLDADADMTAKEEERISRGEDFGTTFFLIN